MGYSQDVLEDENKQLKLQLRNLLTALAALCFQSPVQLHLTELDLLRASDATVTTAPDGFGGIFIIASHHADGQEEKKQAI